MRIIIISFCFAVQVAEYHRNWTTVSRRLIASSQFLIIGERSNFPWAHNLLTQTESLIWAKLRLSTRSRTCKPKKLQKQTHSENASECVNLHDFEKIVV